MMKTVYAFVLLIGTLLNTSVAEFVTLSDKVREPTTARDIFQPPGDSDVSQISGTSTPWVFPDVIHTIEEFKKNVFEDLMNNGFVQNIWDMTTESAETRAIFFKIANKNLYDLGHPVTTALANTVSKAGSLFDPLNMTVYFEADAIHLAEFLLSRGVEIKRETATRYVDSISEALYSAESNNKKAVWQAISNGYDDFVESYQFKLIDCIDELLELFASELIVLHDK